jgi:hypothetical protein
MEMTTLAEADSTLFQGNASQVAHEILVMLRLNEQFKFPIRRLVHLEDDFTLRRMMLNSLVRSLASSKSLAKSG